ncbi:DUF1508 domain-containing protein (plasmid) [Nocardia sp. PE-7]|uniref:YegP family protein n=1 Tax=Nocardia sp. PE-7 TaxID=3058426 RepID=UPI002657C283|nr:DUF1508 domain-containing protein [Nocardia sp. PE-7]WKG13601.1 DUF1508 domain-containing protein [Nocardia sp. PE-7]
MAGEINIFTGSAGGYRWHLKASNGEIIATSHAFSSKAAVIADIEKLKANLCGAQVTDRTAATRNPHEKPPSVVNVTHNYHGPVVQQTGDGNSAQLAWNNTGTVNQGQANTEQIAPGYEQLATVITDLLANLPVVGFDDPDEADVRETAETLLTEVTQSEPNQTLIRRGVAALKGYLAQIAHGAAEAVTEEASEVARSTIEGLSAALPF